MVSNSCTGKSVMTAELTIDSSRHQYSGMTWHNQRSAKLIKTNAPFLTLSGDLSSVGGVGGCEDPDQASSCPSIVQPPALSFQPPTLARSLPQAGTRVILVLRGNKETVHCRTRWSHRPGIHQKKKTLTMPSIVAIDTRFVLDLRLYIATTHQTHVALHGLKSADIAHQPRYKCQYFHQYFLKETKVYKLYWVITIIRYSNNSRASLGFAWYCCNGYSSANIVLSLRDWLWHHGNFSKVDVRSR